MNEQSSFSLFRSRAHAIHARLIAAIADLVHTRNASRQRDAWRTLEASLLAHLGTEADLMLPDFGLLHADEAAHVRGNHELIRQSIARVHATSTAGGLDPLALGELDTLLRDCAAFEERQLYPWAERQLRASKKGEFLHRAREQAPNDALS